MKCPIDNTELVMSERHGIEIDYCPQCRGVWLDRGELDKILERAAGPAPAPPPAYEQRRPEPRYDDRREDRRYDSRYGDRPPQKKRRESFLDDLFDFG